MTVNWQNRIWEISTMQNETIKVLGFRRGITTWLTLEVPPLKRRNGGWVIGK